VIILVLSVVFVLFRKRHAAKILSEEDVGDFFQGLTDYEGAADNNYMALPYNNEKEIDENEFTIGNHYRLQLV